MYVAPGPAGIIPSIFPGAWYCRALSFNSETGPTSPAVKESEYFFVFVVAPMLSRTRDCGPSAPTIIEAWISEGPPSTSQRNPWATPSFQTISRVGLQIGRAHV